MRTAIYTLGALVAFFPGLAFSASEPESTTDLDDIVMYAINNDVPNQLLRYSFAAVDAMPIGQVIDQNGYAPEELECLAYIPSGDHKGFYAASNIDDEDVHSVLVKIDPLTAACFRYPVEIGFGYTVGMIPVQNPITGDWAILATHCGRTDNGSGPKEKNLIRIDPATGKGAVVMSLDNLYEGLAQAEDGTLYGIRRFKEDGETNAQLWRIDPVADKEVQVGPDMNKGRIESLEFAFGDMAAAIETYGLVPPSWTKDGVLLAFSDSEDAFLIIHPQTGQVASYQTPFIDPATDAEGIVFFTSTTDPFGAVLADSHD
jgi:hypothetical protein